VSCRARVNGRNRIDGRDRVVRLAMARRGRRPGRLRRTVGASDRQSGERRDHG
jgi:hypothetical protein